MNYKYHLLPTDHVSRNRDTNKENRIITHMLLETKEKVPQSFAHDLI